MKLLGNGWTTAESTFAGTTAGAGEAAVAGSGTYGAGPGQFVIRKVVAFTGGSTVAPNTSGGLHLRVGDSSLTLRSTYVVLPMTGNGAGSTAVPLSPLKIELDGLYIKCNWFEAISQEAATGGWGIYVFGD